MCCSSPKSSNCSISYWRQLVHLYVGEQDEVITFAMFHMSLQTSGLCLLEPVFTLV